MRPVALREHRLYHQLSCFLDMTVIKEHCDVPVRREHSFEVFGLWSCQDAIFNDLEVLRLLNQHGKLVIVFCGHSKTNYRAKKLSHVIWIIKVVFRQTPLQVNYLLALVKLFDVGQSMPRNEGRLSGFCESLE